MMSDQTDKSAAMLQELGLEKVEATIYLTLNSSTSSTALELSKKLRIARTKVYRILDKLIDYKLVIKVPGERGLKFKAAPPSNLELLVIKQENKAKSLRESLEETVYYLQANSSASGYQSQINYYNGIEGLKQITWNSLHATDHIRIFEIRDMSAFLDFGFAEKVRDELTKRKNLYQGTHKPD